MCEVATRKTEEEWGGACSLTKLIFCFLRGGKRKKDEWKIAKEKQHQGKKIGCVFSFIKNILFIIIIVYECILECKKTKKKTNKNSKIHM